MTSDSGSMTSAVEDIPELRDGYSEELKEAKAVSSLRESGAELWGGNKMGGGGGFLDAPLLTARVFGLVVTLF